MASIFKPMIRKTLLPAALLFLPFLAPAQAPAKPEVLLPDFTTGSRIAAGYSEQEVLRHLKVLASDSMEGRETGQRGQKMAAAYIESQFKHLGLKPLFVNGTDSSYRQVFPIFRTRVASAELSSNGKSYMAGRDFMPLPPVADSLVGKNMAFVFIAPNSPIKGVEGAAVLILDTMATHTEGRRSFQPMAKPYYDAGARLVLIATPFKGYTRQVVERGWPRIKHGAMLLERPVAQTKSTKGLAIVSMQMAGELMGTDSSTLAAIVEAKGGPSTQKALSKLTKPTRTMDVDIRSGRDELATENVGAFLPGRVKPDEVVVMTAHYDHLGIMDGKVYNGADDDGSGTSNVLEMARLFSEAAVKGTRPYRSVAFLLFTGEEKGLLGSEYYSQHPAFPMAQTGADLNTDMIGRVDEKHATTGAYTYLIGADKISRNLNDLVMETNRQCCNLEVNLEYNDEHHPDQFYYRSDHYNFAKKGVPVAFFFTGVHEDYHQPTDDVEKILLPRMSAIGRFIFLTAWGVAQRPAMLERVK